MRGIVFCVHSQPCNPYVEMGKLLGCCPKLVVVAAVFIQNGRLSLGVCDTSTCYMCLSMLFVLAGIFTIDPRPLCSNTAGFQWFQFGFHGFQADFTRVKLRLVKAT